jgi:glycosyltransferase involved in cell wall biosynthesis
MKKREELMAQLTFHLLGLANLETDPQISVCPFIQKIVNLSKMLKKNGHIVYFYGVEGSKVPCDRYFQVSTQAVLLQTYGPRDKTTNFLTYDPGDAAHCYFNDHAIPLILENKSEGDILLCPMGLCHKAIADAVGLPAVEPGIGYPGTFAPFRVFESYAWMHYLYGRQGMEDGGWYDAIIPNYYDPDEFPFCADKQDYLLYLGRITGRKGVSLASEVAKATGNRLYVVGPGALDNPAEGLALGGEEHLTYHPAVGPAERAKLLGGARAVLMPSYYLEPFGSVCVEAALCGTPIITTDWGAFPETVAHGVTGYRCRTFEEFCWAVEHIDRIRPEACRRWAVEHYSMERVRGMYEEYFQRLHRLYHGGWYAENPSRTELDWLCR